jgi:hypothetical protein
MLWGFINNFPQWLRRTLRPCSGSFAFLAGTASLLRLRREE